METIERVKPSKKIRRNKSDWQQLVNEWQDSGKTQLAFCQERNLCYRQFNQWKSQFRKEKASDKAGNEGHFIPVTVAKPSPVDPHQVEVILPNGIQIRFQRSEPVAKIAELTHIIREKTC